MAKGAEYLEKHFSNNKSIGIDTQMAHVCSMDFNDLSKLREIADGLTLIKSSERKYELSNFEKKFRSNLVWTYKIGIE